MEEQFIIKNKGDTEYLVSIHQQKVEVMPLLEYQLHHYPCVLIATSQLLIAQHQLTRSNSNPYLTLIQFFDRKGWLIRQLNED
jgi:hypothetical protein